jgi:hypothetical protein
MLDIFNLYIILFLYSITVVVNLIDLMFILIYFYIVYLDLHIYNNNHNSKLFSILNARSHNKSESGLHMHFSSEYGMPNIDIS